jgi:HAD superfamily hydrolase (TIGR01549 family)
VCIHAKRKYRGLKAIQAVFFDLFETVITEFDPEWQPGLSVAERLGMDEETFEAEWKARQRSRYTCAHPDYRGVLREICVSADRPVDGALIERLYRERLADKRKPFERIEDEVTQMLVGIRDSGVKLGLVSNCAPEEVAGWPDCALRPLFDDAVLSYEVGCTKPDPEIYLLACKRLGVEPRHSIFVGDGGSDELAGAARVGMRPCKAVWFLSRWPGWKESEHASASVGCPVLERPADLVSLLVRDIGSPWGGAL